MPCAGRTFELWLLLGLTIFCVFGTGAESPGTPNSLTQYQTASTNILPVERKQKSITPPVEANTSLSVFVDTKAVLHCPNATLDAVVVTWAVTFRDQTSCSRDYRTDNNKTSEKTCTDERISWDFRPDQNFALQINPVAITHEGYYKCEVVTPDGNFGHGHHLRVLVPPKVALSLGENGTTVCWAVAGSPAAQISWTPTGDCHTVEERLGNDTVTVQSTCHWEDRQVSEVSCFVSHVTGNKSLSIEMNPGYKLPLNWNILYIMLSVLILFIIIIIGCVLLFKICGCRKCKLGRKEATTVVEEDEMQPYASYTEKNNPLYDTVSKG
ncbi:cell surface glycoprotein CD200 receptor 1 isoform X2 [Vulpes lagopus]|uniref:cell surface glycoprotein CD200 receptor 1 isoform X2 n=1 Tax=Vulpes lagopus TaxID=494514 RepID=UPI001BCA1FEE|nr:cell surface glycoprotein CD200 receptor 1 isoform X2 [Vulpes lagopus]